MIEIIEPGPFASVQDAGRIGYAASGVPRSGAFDRAALRLANRLVGNSDDAAALEITLGGLVARFHRAATVALAGAASPGLDWGVAITLTAGTTIRLGVPRTGLRSYLAVRGGLAVEAQLGSRSTDTLSGLGPPPLRSGDLVPIGAEHPAEVGGTAAAPRPAPARLPVMWGPRDDWFTPGALGLLTATAWIVRPDSNRIGIRLDGPQLDRARTEELPSEPALPGAVQVPPDGRPILFGPDAPITGGYPVIAVVRRADLDAAAQLRPGDRVGFISTRDG
ncbi:MAG: allophanate hydrolase [Pseudonocardiales bacterium]|nr:allophanate hydrolase [Pseudonocardiales bacterium]